MNDDLTQDRLVDYKQSNNITIRKVKTGLRNKDLTKLIKISKAEIIQNKIA